ncbi:MAG: hypothetical protein ABI168_06015 [Ginsengibacter sp.]
MAILKFRIYWEEDDSVYRDITIMHNQTFFDLHQIILKCFEFDNKHAATFFRSNDQWQRGKEISLEKYDKEYKAQPLLMADTSIGTEIKDPNQKFIFLYDFHKNWTFLVELINVNKDTMNSGTYPAVVRSEGMGPSQYGTKGIVNEKLAELEEKYDFSSSILSDGFTEEGEEGEGVASEENEEAEEENNEEV